MKPSPIFKTGSGTNDNDVVIQQASNAEQYDTWQLCSTAGAMDVFVSSDGTNFMTAPLALIDLGSTTPATAVVETSANGHYGFKGRWRAVRVLQKGATAVANAVLTGYLA
jgi:hypothetical protein